MGALVIHDYTHRFKAVSNLDNYGRGYMASFMMAKTRLVIVLFFVALLWCLLLGKLFYLGICDHGDTGSSGRIYEKPTFQVGRGRILDRNGTILATSLRVSSLYCNPKKIQDHRVVAKALNKIFPQHSEKRFKEMLESDKSFLWLARGVTPSQKKALLYLGNPELKFIQDEKRIYPQGALFSHIIGLVDQDNSGIAGLEKSLETRLRTSGEDVKTSLDIKLQYALHSELMYGMQEFQASGASAILMDANTSEILAIVSLPDYDPNHSVSIGRNTMFNRAVSGVYEMGSTFKIFNTALGLKQKGVTIHKSYNTSEPLKVGRFNITDYRADHGVINLAQIFVHSSNKGSARIALDCGGESQRSFFQTLKMLEPASIGIPESSRPIYPLRWREANTITASYGYGLAISPMQLLNAAASVLVDGCRKQAYLIKSPENHPRECEQVVSKKTARTLRQLMYLATCHGTSKRTYVPGFYVGAKTGTRNMLAEGRYDKNRVATSFIGVIGESVDKPAYILVLMLEDPKRLKKTFGFNASGWNAAPIGGRILNRVAALKGLRPQKGSVMDSFDRDLLQIDFRRTR